MSNEIQAVLEVARTLPREDDEGRLAGRLRGRHFALLAESDDDPSAVLFRRAVDGLGGRVTHIRLSQAGLDDDRELARTAQMLGRLYVAVECQGAPASLVPQLSRAAGIPAFDGVATAAHPTASLIESLPDGIAADRRRAYVVQAVLLRAVG